MKNNKKIACKLKISRAKKGLTIDELVDKSGVSKATIINLEKGTKSFRLETLLKVSKVLDIEIENLLEGE